MVTMKRKITEQKDKFGSFDSYIEVDDIKENDAVSYTTRSQTAKNTAKSSGKNTVSISKKGETMPQIRSQKAAAEVKEVIGFKTKMLLITYVAVAIILAAIVIGTGVAITNANNQANQLQSTVNTQSEQLMGQYAKLDILNDPSYIIGEAVTNLDMEMIADYEIIPQTPATDPVTYTPSTSLFDKISRFISSLFN